MAAQPTVEVAVGLEVSDDPEVLERVAGALQQDLLELDATSVARQRLGAAPPDSRAVDLLAIGKLIVTLGKNAAALRAVVDIVRSKLGHRDRTATLEIDGDKLVLTGISSETEERLVTSWIERHSQPPPVVP